MLGWGARQRGGASAEVEHVLPTKVLSRFLEVMSLCEAPVLMDLGAVVGSNVTFLGERLGCRLTVEDVYADLERFAREGRMGDVAAFFGTRFPQADGSVDGVLCWDLLDYLDRPTAATLCAELVRVLRPGGALMAFFAAEATAGDPQYTRFVIKDDRSLAHRPYAASHGKQVLLTNRDVTRLFDGLKVSDSYLLLSHTREMLFRK